MAAGGGGGGSVSARALARSVAHRLKYYIDVQRKEHSFDSSGLIRDEIESSSCHTHPACLIEWQHGRPLEHDFAEIKLEAFLRTYLGSTNECFQRVQDSPEKRKDLEKFIKKMARDYVPDQTNEGRTKKTQRQSYWLRAPSSLHRTATPSMSAEEVRRLVSSASKFVVAATSEVSPKGTTREAVSTPKRGATKIIPSSDRAWKQSLPSPRLPKDETESIQVRHEEFKTELNQTASEKNGGRKPKATKKRKNVKYRERPTEMSSSVSRNSSKSNELLSTMLPKSNNFYSVNVSFPSPYSPAGQNKVFRKGILKNRRSLSSTSSDISECQNIQPDSQWKGSLHPPAGQSHKLLEIKRKKSSCTSPMGMTSRWKISRSRQPVLTSRNTPEVMRNNMEVHSVTQTAEVMHAQNSQVSKKTGKRYNPKEVSGYAVCSGPGKELHGQGNWKSEFSGKPQRGWPEETKGGFSSASEKNSERHQVHFQMLQQSHHPKNIEQKHNSENCILDDLRQPENPTLPMASVDESGEILAGLQDDQDKDNILTVTRDPSRGYQVCQGEDQGATASSAVSEAMKIDSAVGNRDIKGHSGDLLNQILSLNEADARAVDDPMQINDLIFGEQWDEQVVYIPPSLSSVGETSEEGDSSSASSDRSTPVPRRLGDEESEEEFTISSASSCLSAKSLASTESRDTSARLKEGEENADSSAEVHVPNMMQESSTIQQGTFDQHSERQRLKKKWQVQM